MTDQDCEAKHRGCGTRDGWRRGGRCVRCRRAHNRDSRQYRGLSPEERQQVLSVLRAGVDPEEVARAVGRTGRSLQVMSVRDGELRAALDGEPLELQRLARRGDFIGAMIRYGGNQAEAAREIGESTSAVQNWVRDDPQFAAVVKAVMGWVTSDELPSPRSKVTKAMLDRAVELLDGPHSLAEVSRRVGLSVVTLYRWEERHPPLAAALERRRSRRVAETEGGLAAEWMSRPLEERIAEVVRLIKGGWTNRAAAAAVGTNVWALYKQRAEFPELAAVMSRKERSQSAAPRKKRRRGPDATPETNAQLREAWGDLDVTVAELAKRFGVAAATLTNRARKLGLPDRNELRRERAT